jgi:hypothetical protein
VQPCSESFSELVNIANRQRIVSSQPTHVVCAAAPFRSADSPSGLASKLCGSSQECLPGALAPFVYALQALDACSPYRWVTLKAFLSWRWPYQRAGHLAVWLCESTLRVIFVFRPKRHHGRRWKTGPSSPLLAKGLGPLLVGSLRQAVSPGIFRHEAPSPLPLGPVTQSHAMFWGFGLWHRSPASWEEAPGEIPQVYMLDMKPASLM